MTTLIHRYLKCKRERVYGPAGYLDFSFFRILFKGFGGGLEKRERKINIRENNK